MLTLRNPWSMTILSGEGAFRMVLINSSSCIRNTKKLYVNIRRNIQPHKLAIHYSTMDQSFFSPTLHFRKAILDAMCQSNSADRAAFLSNWVTQTEKRFPTWNVTYHCSPEMLPGQLNDTSTLTFCVSRHLHFLVSTIHLGWKEMECYANCAI